MRTLIAALSLFATAATGFALDVYVQLHRFHWEEHNQEGRPLLEEDGPLLGLGVAGSSRVAERLDWSSRLEGFLGEVDYDGSTILGAPVRTTTAYYGAKGETDLRWKVGGPTIATGPLGGISTRGWLRRLDNSQRDSNGYDEAWWIVYARAGWYADWTMTARGHLTAEAAVRLPLYNSARYSLTGTDGSGNVSVKPGHETSLEASLTWRTTGWLVGLTYEDFQFGLSDPEPLPPFEIFQPESEGRLLSLRAGLVF